MRSTVSKNTMSYKVFLWLAGFISILVIGVSVTYKTLSTPLPGEHRYFPIERIAHAGGGYNKKTYTNSINALEANKDSYNFFEIDFVWTSDQHLVCLHDWDASAKAAFGNVFDPVPTLYDFEGLVRDNAKYKNCTAETLIAWLESNPEKKIVTDVKKGNVLALKYIANMYPDYAKRFIPQIYNPEQYEPVKKMGYEKIIFTLYRYSGDHSEVLKAVSDMSLYAVTVPKRHVRSEISLDFEKWGLPHSFITVRFPYDLAQLNIPTYVHTVNNQEEWMELQRLGVSEIYTDWLGKTN